MRKLIFLLAAATVVAAAYIAEATPAAEARAPAAREAPATLTLTLGTPATFAPFTPGVAKDYDAGTTATVTSTAGNATLTVHDPSAAATGHLVNGAFSLPQSLRARASSPAGSGGTAYNNVGGTASPLTLLTYSAPVSDDPVSLQFRQSMGANDALRSGTYSKTLTFTLSTTDGPCSLTLVAGSGPSTETASCSPLDTVIAETEPPVEATTSVGGSVPATLSLTLGAPAAFGAFTPGVTNAYEAGTSANVISTAGDATLTVHDASTNAPGHLVNGAFSLPQSLRARASSPAGAGTAYNPVSDSPLTLLAYSAPVANDSVALQFSQNISANDALRTGTYSKTLTFTLSTTAPRCSLSLTLVAGSGPTSATADCGSTPDAVIVETTAATEAAGSVAGTVPATLSLTLGPSASFGEFTPCVTKTYLAGTTANLISTAANATLTVHDASVFATGHLVNGTFSLPQPLQARANGTAFNSVGGSASPLTLLTRNGPVSNDAVSLDYSQLINAGDALRTGTYSKTLTFTLSSTDEFGSTASASPVTGSTGTPNCGPSTAFAIAPTSPNGSGGWYKGNSPTVTLTPSGGTSGIASTSYTVGGVTHTYTGPFTLPDGDSVVVTYWSTDNAGNVEPTNTSATYKVDTVAPSVTLTTPGDGAIYRQGATVPADYSCDDGTSGVASCAGSVDDGEPIDTSTLGWHTFTVDAGDEAGNEAAPVSHSYYVAVTTTSKPHSWGKIQVGPGTTVRVGYDFSLTGKHPAVQVLFVQPQVEFAVTCVSNGVTTSLVVPMADYSQSVPAKSTAWWPSGDQKSSLVYQGSLTVPGDLCGGGQALLGQARFSAGILAGETVKLSYRWHTNVNGKGGGWSETSSLTPTLLPPH